MEVSIPDHRCEDAWGAAGLPGGLLPYYHPFPNSNSSLKLKLFRSTEHQTYANLTNFQSLHQASFTLFFCIVSSTF